MDKDNNRAFHPLEDYWKEASSFEESTHADEDEYDSKTPDEGEIEEEWLREAGFHSLVDSEMTDDQASYEELLSTLTTRQRAVVQKRLQTVQISKKQKRHPRGKQRADVRQVFCNQATSEILPSDSDNNDYSSTPGTAHCTSSPPVQNRPTVFKGAAAAVPEEQPKNSRSTASVLPPFLRTGHSGGFSLREHCKAIDTEGPTSVEVLKYEARTSVIQDKALSQPYSEEAKARMSPEPPEISFQGIASRLDPMEDVGEPEKDVMWEECYPVADLSEEDRSLVRSLAVIEVAALLDSHGLVPSRRRKRNGKKGKENIVFGSSLTALLELDRRRCPGVKIPLIYQWVLHHLHENGLNEEGLMRLAGSIQKIEALKAEAERSYLNSPVQLESSIRQSSVHDASVLLKQLVRLLPEPLLTNCHMDTFLQVPNIPSLQGQVNTLNLLVLVLPDVHRELLQELLYFLAKVVEQEEQNRMSLGNVAMIMAPNLFPPPRLKKGHKNNDLAAEVTV